MPISLTCLKRYVGVIINVITFTLSTGAWPASYVVGAEVSSLRLRAKTQGIGWALGGVANCVFSTVSPFIYNADAGNLRSKVGFVWAGFCVFTVAACWYVIPEMLGRSPLQLDLMFEAKIPARKFRNWSGGEEEITVLSEDKQCKG